MRAPHVGNTMWAHIVYVLQTNGESSQASSDKIDTCRRRSDDNCSASQLQPGHLQELLVGKIRMSSESDFAAELRLLATQFQPVRRC